MWAQKGRRKGRSVSRLLQTDSSLCTTVLVYEIKNCTRFLWSSVKITSFISTRANKRKSDLNDGSAEATLAHSITCKSLQPAPWQNPKPKPFPPIWRVEWEGRGKEGSETIKMTKQGHQWCPPQHLNHTPLRLPTHSLLMQKCLCYFLFSLNRHFPITPAGDCFLYLLQCLI